MKSAADKLSLKEKKALALWYDSESYKALKHLIKIERELLAQDHVGQRDILEVCDLTGQTKSLKKLVRQLEVIYKAYQDKG